MVGIVEIKRWMLHISLINIINISWILSLQNLPLLLFPTMNLRTPDWSQTPLTFESPASTSMSYYVVLRIESRTSWLLGKHSTNWVTSLSTSNVVSMVIHNLVLLGFSYVFRHTGLSGHLILQILVHVRSFMNTVLSLEYHFHPTYLHVLPFQFSALNSILPKDLPQSASQNSFPLNFPFLI